MKSQIPVIINNPAFQMFNACRVHNRRDILAPDVYPQPENSLDFLWPAFQREFGDQEDGPSGHRFLGVAGVGAAHHAHGQGDNVRLSEAVFRGVKELIE
jgi:hypothetical protein